MKAMILAGGLGTRLRPITKTMPKCMVQVHKKPLLEYIIWWMSSYGIGDIIINLNITHFPQVVMDYFEDGRDFGVKISYSIESEILGTAGGVKKVESFFNNEPFLVWYGDHLSTINLRYLTLTHQIKKGIGTLAIYQRDNVTESGIVDLDKNSLITAFKEKPKEDEVFSHWANAAIFVLEPEIFKYIPTNTYYDFSYNVFPALVNRNLYAYKMKPNELFWWIDSEKDLKYTEKTFNDFI